MLEQLQGKVNLKDRVIFMLPPKHRKSDMITMNELGVTHHFIKPVGRTHFLQVIYDLLGDEKIGETSGLHKRKKEKSTSLLDKGLLRILIAEDSEDSQAVVKLFLRDGPFHLDFAADPELVGRCSNQLAKSTACVTRFLPVPFDR